MNVRIRQCIHGLAAGILVVAWSGVGMAQSTDPANGVWKLNSAKSTFSPGPAPKELTLTIESAGGGRKVTVNGVAGDGTPVQWGFSGNFDGKEIRITGNNPDADGITSDLPPLGQDWTLGDADYLANKESGKRLLYGQQSNFWYKKGFEFIFSQPSQFLELTARKIIFLFKLFNDIFANRSCTSESR